MLVAHVTYESWGGSFDHWLATTKAPTHPAGNLSPVSCGVDQAVQQSTGAIAVDPSW